MPIIFDNIDFHLNQGLEESLLHSIRADFCVGYFNLRGWNIISSKIDTLSGGIILENDNPVFRTCRLLVGMQKLPSDLLREFLSSDEEYLIDQSEVNKLKKQLAKEFKDQLTIGAPSDIDEITLRKLSSQLKEKKVVVKLHLNYPLHAKLYLCHMKERKRVEGFLGSSNLTMAGLKKQGELNVDVLEQDAALKLEKWFNDRWDERWSIDITDELIEIIDNSWAADRLVPPYHVYLKMAYHLSQEARAGLSEYQIPVVFRKELLPFQQAAVLIAAKKLYKREGVFIGDVVGLGKTITACALAKLFEEEFYYSTLIICPPNLKHMWAGYVNKYDMKANIISIGVVQHDLADMKRYKVVIIDESHNLRNDQGRRYNAIKEYLRENECKVILLSATPYNKSYLDLSNQLRLFIHDDTDIGLSPEKYINSIGGQIQFNAKHTDTYIKSIKAFERSNFSEDWQELMKLYMVRRTRSFIKKNYANEDKEKNRYYLTFSDGTKSYFPDRIPKKIEFGFDKKNKKDQYANLYSADVVNMINSLALPRYGLGNFINEKTKLKPSKDEETIIANLSRAGKRLMGFCRTNLFKRLESSGYAFLISLSRHVLRNYVFFYAIQNRLPVPIGKDVSQNLDNFIEDKDLDTNIENGEKNQSIDSLISFLTDENKYLQSAADVYNLFASDKNRDKFDWIRSEFFVSDLTQLLASDCNEILNIINLVGKWDVGEDRKLNALCNLINNRHPDVKILVFTQFADTANYIHSNLKCGEKKLIACATGDSDNPTALAQRFSPVSNGQRPSKNDLRVLISTDVLSEGQNLQDAHIIVNYDLPWAIIRLIQRAGRVDRIGQMSDEILCYSFLPEEGIEKIIRLRERLKGRIKENAEVVGSDEVFFDGDPINIVDLYNEKSGILDDDENDTEVDLASYAFQIWKNATDENQLLKKIIPNLADVVYATKKNNHLRENEGVIVYTHTQDESDILSWVDAKGKLITQSQMTILKAVACHNDETPLFKIDKHHQLVKESLSMIRTDEKLAGGSLGRKSGAKYRVYMRLDAYCKHNENTLFVSDSLKKAIDDIFKFPLKEFARDTLNRQLKTGIRDEDLADLVVSLREEDKLCIVNDNDLLNHQPRLICSMGLKNN